MDKKESLKYHLFFNCQTMNQNKKLIFFPTSIYLDKNKYVNISYNVGDNRSYYLRLHLDIINISLYKKKY